MELPEFPVMSDETWDAISLRHGLGNVSIARMPQIGTFNAIYGIGEELLLRLPRHHPRFVGAAHNEAIAVPLARAAGVRTPNLLLFDDDLDILPVPYSIYERVPGVELERAVADPATAAPVWQELGRDLARLHTGVARQAPATDLIEWDEKTDPRPLPGEIARAGYFTAVEADWLDGWLERLAPYAVPGGPVRFLHGDSQAANVMVDPDSVQYAAVIDWGSCRWADIAIDFAGVPLRAVPALLSGYRELVSDEGEALEARIVWRHLQIALHQLRGRPVPEWSWAERPIGMLLEILRFFGEGPGRRWQQWGPWGRG